MGQSSDTVFKYLQMAKTTDEASFCRLIKSYHKLNGGIENTFFYEKIGLKYAQLVDGCHNIEEPPKEKVNIVDYARAGGFDVELVRR